MNPTHHGARSARLIGAAVVTLLLLLFLWPRYGMTGVLLSLAVGAVTALFAARSSPSMPREESQPAPVNRADPVAQGVVEPEAVAADAAVTDLPTLAGVLAHDVEPTGAHVQSADPEPTPEPERDVAQELLDRLARTSPSVRTAPELHAILKALRERGDARAVPALQECARAVDAVVAGARSAGAPTGVLSLVEAVGRDARATIAVVRVRTTRG